ncbi:hypothetical protein WUBG_13426, partial [Wuchereria bancrofti]
DFRKSIFNKSISENEKKKKVGTSSLFILSCRLSSTTLGEVTEMLKLTCENIISQSVMNTVKGFCVLPNGFYNLVNSIDLISSTLTDNLDQLTKRIRDRPANILA